MNRTGRHRSPIPIVRILWMVMIAVMLAQPVMAALSATIGCERNCCCCQVPDQDAYPEIRGTRTHGSGCCGASGAGTACHVSSKGQSDRPPALIRGMVQKPSDDGCGMPDAPDAMYPPAPAGNPDFRAVPRSSSASPPLYLKICRLIC